MKPGRRPILVAVEDLHWRPMLEELGLQLFMRCPEGSVQFDRNSEIAKTPIERWSHDTPLQFALATAERRDGQRCDAALSNVGPKVSESFDDIVEL